MSRSIASAINRRAGNNAPRPNVPPNQQSSYNPKIAQPQSQGQQVPKNVRFVPSGQGQQGQPIQQRQAFQEPTIPVKTAGVNGPVGQVSISDAFALVTIRLGRVEQFVQQVQEEGLPFTNDHPENNSSQIDTDLKNLQTLFQTQEDTIHILTKKVENYESTFLNYDKEIRDLKDMILTMTMKNEKNMIETTNHLTSLGDSVKSTEENVKSVEDSVRRVEEKHDLLKKTLESQEQINNTTFEEVLEETQEVVEERQEPVENA